MSLFHLNFNYNNLPHTEPEYEDTKKTCDKLVFKMQNSTYLEQELFMNHEGMALNFF